MQWVDIAILIVIGLSVLTGLFRGFVKEFVSLCVWIVAVWLAFNYSQTLDPWLSPYINDHSIRTGVGFVIILLGTLLVGGIINLCLSFILKQVGLSGTDRILGIVFGFIRGVFIVSMVMIVVKMTSLPYQQYAQTSKFYRYFDPVVDIIYSHLPNMIKEIKQADKSSQKIIDTVPVA